MTDARQARVPQDPFLWRAMARGSAAAASQMAWQGPDEMREQRELFVKVTESGVDEPNWRRAVTWNSAVLVALSAEQSLKALAIMASATSTQRHTHDLQRLWNVVGNRTQVRIRAELEQIRGRLAGTRLAQGTLSAGEIVRHHRSTFERARYYNEIDPAGAANELTHNIDLWQFALAAYSAVSLALTTAVDGMAPVGEDVSWEEVVQFNGRIGWRIPEWEVGV